MAAESGGRLAPCSPGELRSCIVTSLCFRCCGTRMECCGGSWKGCVSSYGRAGLREGCQQEVKRRRCLSISSARTRFPLDWIFHGGVGWLVVPELLLPVLALGSHGRDEGGSGW